jgi:hypothetical protein
LEEALGYGLYCHVSYEVDSEVVAEQFLTGQTFDFNSGALVSLICVQKAGKTPLPGGETSAGYIINKKMILKYITELPLIYHHKGIAWMNQQL